MSWSVPEIFATKLQSCSKSRAQSILGRLASAYNFLISAQKFINFLFNAAGIAFNEVCLLFLIYWPVLEIFAVKVKSCHKSRRILDVFVFPNLRKRCPQMLYISDNAHLTSRQVAKFHGVTPSDPEVLGANMLHFKPIFGLFGKNCWGPPFPVGFGLAKLGHSVARVKISGRSTP